MHSGKAPGGGGLHHGLDRPFVISTNATKADPETRKLIRSHVMRGKNRKRAPRQEQKEDPQNRPIRDPEHVEIPQRVGSDFTFLQVADTVEPSMLADVMNFSSIAKPLLFPLERCILFDKIDESWFQLLTIDATYLNAMVFATTTHFDVVFHRKTKSAGQVHFGKTLRLLRERLSASDEKNKISDSTIMVVIVLAIHAYMIGDHESAMHHMKGVSKMVRLRGGTATFHQNQKLLIEIVRCDIGMALHNGTKPLFFIDCPSLETFPDSIFAGLSERLVTRTNPQLATVWGIMKAFCLQISTVAKPGDRLSKQTLLNVMSTVMYRLLSMSFDIGSIDEAIRLGLLGFSSHVFLQWQSIRHPYAHFSTTYRKCLTQLKSFDGVPSQILLWLLMIGAISAFTELDDDWLRPWLRANIELLGIKSWDEIRGVLDSFLWIGFLHDRPGKAIFDSLQLDIG